LVSCFLLMPSLSKEINLGVNSLSFTLYKFDFVRFKFGQLIRDACRFQPLATTCLYNCMIHLYTSKME
jgi:hypothetical protein